MRHAGPQSKNLRVLCALYVSTCHHTNLHEEEENMISLSKLENIRSQSIKRTECRVDFGGDLALFENVSDAEDVEVAMKTVDDVVSILSAAIEWKRNPCASTALALCVALDQVRP